MAASPSKTVKIQVIALVALIAAWQSYQFAVTVNLRLADPEAALQRQPDDAFALAKVVKNKSRAAEEYVSDAADTSAAIQSLVKTPLSRSSLRIIGMNSAAAGEAQTAFAAMSLADRVSRRDTTAQIWLLERAAASDNFDAILRHYDAAMSVSPELGPILLPIMVDALQYRQVREGMRTYVLRQARWMPGFLSLASRDASLDNLVDLMRPVAGALSGEEYEPSVAQIIYRLAANSGEDAAMELAEAVWGDFDAEKFSDSSPSEATLDRRLGLLAWELGEDSGIQSRLNVNGAIEITMRPLSRGVVVRRHFPVEGGQTYNLMQRVNFKGEGGARLAWRGDCVTNSGSERIWEQALPTSMDAVTYRSEIAIPSQCNILALSLTGNGADGQLPTDASISEFSFSNNSAG